MNLEHLDHALLTILRTRGHNPTAERWLGRYSRLGEHAACWLALGAAGAVLDRDPDRRRQWRHGSRVILAAYGLNYAVKVTVRRPRPRLPGLPPLTPTVSGLSFPSAHSTTSFAAASAFRDLAPPGLLYAVAVLFGLTRPYLGVHYPSDVAVGAALGSVLAGAWRP